MPADPGAAQRRYEALRAYFVEGRSAAEVAAALGYTTAAFESVVRDFRAGDREFFVERRPGPKVAPAKEAARARNDPRPKYSPCSWAAPESHRGAVIGSRLAQSVSFGI